MKDIQIISTALELIDNNYLKMIAQIFLGAVLVAAASAGHATSYAIGGIGHGGLGHDHGYGGSYSGSYGAAIIGGHDQHVVDYHAPAHYEFQYGVEDHHTGDKKQQSETRSGDVVHSGHSWAEHDRNVHVSRYTAGDHAVVHSIGHAVHPHIALVHQSHHGLEHGSYGHGY